MKDSGIHWEGLAWSTLGSAIVLWAGYCLWFYWGENYRAGMSSITLPSGLWQVVEGQGEIEQGEIRLTLPGQRAWATAAANLEQTLAADEVERVRFRVMESAGAMEITAGFAPSASLLRFLDHSVVMDEKGWVELDVADLAFHYDEIGYVVVRARGSMDPPVVFGQVELIPAQPSFPALQAQLWRSLVNLESWTQRSINHQIPDFSPLRVSPVLAVVFWICLSMLLYALLVVCRPAFRALLVPAGVMFLIGWLMLDIIWQVRLWANHADAVSVYRGKSPEERRLAEVDGSVFAFIEELKQVSGDGSRRMLIFGGSDFSHLRAKYFAVPQSANSRRGVSEGWLLRAQPDDMLVLIQVEERLHEHNLPSVDESMVEAGRVALSLDEMLGRDGVLSAAQGQTAVRMKPDERPWLLQGGWQDFDAGVWELELLLAVSGQPGWLRIEALVRDEGGDGSQRVAWREVYVTDENFRAYTLPFVVKAHQQGQIRVRELDARGSMAARVSAASLAAEEDMLLLSMNGEPPFWVGKKILEDSVGVAYIIR